MEIIRELTAIKETNTVTSEEVLCCVKRLETQRMQRALNKGTKETKEFKEFDIIKKSSSKIIEHRTQKVEECHKTNRNTVTLYKDQNYVQPTTAVLQDVAK